MTSRVLEVLLFRPTSINMLRHLATLRRAQKPGGRLHHPVETGVLLQFRLIVPLGDGRYAITHEGLAVLDAYDAWAYNDDDDEYNEAL
jgi:hypothetical protein